MFRESHMHDKYDLPNSQFEVQTPLPDTLLAPPNPGRPQSPNYTLLSPPLVLATDDDDEEIVCRWCDGDEFREYDDSTG